MNSREYHKSEKPVLDWFFYLVPGPKCLGPFWKWKKNLGDQVNHKIDVDKTSKWLPNIKFAVYPWSYFKTENNCGDNLG
jgi:hypothetical protein